MKPQAHMEKLKQLGNILFFGRIIARDVFHDAVQLIKYCLPLILAVVIILGSFSKPLREVPAFAILGRLNYYIMILSFAVIPLYMFREKILSLDLLMLASLFSCLLTFLIAGYLTEYSEQDGFMARFILPISTYFLFRYIPLDQKKIVKLIIAFVIIGSIISLIEFVSYNFIFKFPIFAFVQGDSTIPDEQYEKFILGYLPFMGNIFRPWGVVARPQATGSLFAALVVFFVVYRSQTWRMKGQKKYVYFIPILMSLLALIASASKTGVLIMVMMIGFYFIGFNAITLVLFPLLGLFVVFFFTGNFNDLLTGLEPYYLESIEQIILAFSQTDYIYWIYIFFGQGESTLGHDQEFSTEISLINTFWELGLINYVILLFIFITFLRYASILIRRAKDPLPKASIFFVVSLILADLHYGTLFMYPPNILALALMGYVTGQVKRLDDPYGK